MKASSSNILPSLTQSEKDKTKLNIKGTFPGENESFPELCSIKCSLSDIELRNEQSRSTPTLGDTKCSSSQPTIDTYLDKASGRDLLFEHLQSNSTPLQPGTVPDIDKDKQSVVDIHGKQAETSKCTPTKHRSELMINEKRNNIGKRVEQVECLPSLSSSTSTCTFSLNVDTKFHSKSLTTNVDKMRTNTGGYVHSGSKHVTSVTDAKTARGRSGRARPRSQSITFNENGNEHTMYMHFSLCKYM